MNYSWILQYWHLEFHHFVLPFKGQICSHPLVHILIIFRCITLSFPFADTTSNLTLSPDFSWVLWVNSAQPLDIRVPLRPPLLKPTSQLCPLGTVIKHPICLLERPMVSLDAFGMYCVPFTRHSYYIHWTISFCRFNENFAQIFI